MVSSTIVRLTLLAILVILLTGEQTSLGQVSKTNQDYLTTGLFFFPSLTVSSWTADEFDIQGENGTGGGIGIGYGFGQRFSFFINMIGGTLKKGGTEDQYSLAHLDLGARITIGARTSKLKYFVDAMVSGVASENAFPGPEIELDGRMYGAGAGVQYFVLKEIALQAHITTGFGNFNGYKLAGEKVGLETIDRSFRTTRFSVSAVWFALR
jgi:hypothetical protein